MILSLPESGSLSSAKWFAECFFWHSTKKLFAKGKKTLGKKNTRQRSSLPSVFFLTLGVFFYTRQKKFKAHFEAVN
jgi:hypothetical protein